MNHTSSSIRGLQRGFTLIELMVALVLGLLVIGAAGSIFLSNRRVYGSTEAINRIQENQRTAFELLARDVREAGANPCQRFTSTNRPIVLQTAPNATFWTRFPDGLFGVDGTGAGGSDSITLYSGNNSQYNVVQHKLPTDPITVNNTTGLTNGQALMICNTDYAIVFAATSITAGGTTIGHDGAGNCGKGLTPTPDLTQCAATNSGPGYCYQVPGVPPGTPSATDTTNCPKGIGQSPAFVLVPTDAVWTVEANSRGGNSLYRTFAGARSEIAEGITSLRVTYRVGTTPAYVSAANVTAANAWSLVTGVHLAMTFQAAQGAMAQGDNKGTDNSVLTRTLDDFIALRNHQDIQ
ncbi:prepilin-type N-terminal cleavage/methylation domain-containing protein [Solilutibacter silvestris]|uniref:prepilin-type N-terminal cleavage/methylation domain-containing protein n=1 Tax=Solilutibacter silvestris TaxID=1645665 RepID=UPI003D329E36